MKLDSFINYNYLDLSRNYNSREISSSFQHFCEFIFVGLNNNVWLPAEYTKGIIIKENR